MTDRPPFRSWVEDYVHDSRAMPPINMEAFRIRRLQRAKNKRVRADVAAGITGDRVAGKITREVYDRTVGKREAAEDAARQHRLTDPIERARLHLQRRGYRIVRASTLGGPVGRWDIAGRDRWLTDAELVELAKRNGFISKGTDNE